ncbi:hypothetical protein F383_30376 [Gossypium arboreum]|uniref:Uncharacterized protein n=1 Tax=Gossypium arboreum TaxID=29729 RepID=A0A0B0PKD0_GOSAR|nr:hypothetical protein F383_30376 [Gossypium arboreum]
MVNYRFWVRVFSG